MGPNWCCVNATNPTRKAPGWRGCGRMLTHLHQHPTSTSTPPPGGFSSARLCQTQQQRGHPPALPHQALGLRLRGKKERDWEKRNTWLVSFFLSLNHFPKRESPSIQLPKSETLDSSWTPPFSLTLLSPLSLLQTPCKFLTNPSHPFHCPRWSPYHKAGFVPVPRPSFSVYKPPFSLGPKLSFL